MPQPIRLKDHERDARLVRRRVVVGAVLVVMLTLVLVARAYYLQVIQYDHHTTLAENNRIHVQPIPPTRGLIFDRNGVIIADNRPSFSLTVTRERAGDWQAVLDTLVQVLALTAEARGGGTRHSSAPLATSQPATPSAPRLNAAMTTPFATPADE